MAAGALIVIFSAGILATLTSAAEVRVTGRDVRLSDVTSLSGEGSANLGKVVIARLPSAGATRAISHSQLVSLIRRAIPGLTPAGAGNGSVVIRSVIEADAAPAAFDCLELQVDMLAGKPITAADVISVKCDADKAPAAIERDPSTGETMAGKSLEVGDYLGRVQLAEAPAARRGQKLILTSAVGPVVVERPVTAMQGALAKQRRLFVRTDDGQIFAAPIGGVAR